MRFLIEDKENNIRQEPTVYNALKSVLNYIQKYSLPDAFLELYYRFHLTKDEIYWIINKSIQNSYIKESEKNSVIEYAEKFTQYPSWN